MTTNEFLEIVHCVLENVNDFDLCDLISEYEEFLAALNEKERHE